MRLRHAFRQPEHRGQVGVEHRVPVLGLHAQQQLVARDGGVVHQDGRQPFGAFELGQQRIDGCRIADIQHGAAPLEPFAAKAR